ncbi:MAG: winged helix-turn-helix domain-containing protein [Bradyrhizobium sp.]|nr:winged helix-turn-helix domain-containing protein [Bradyrhizobium sp.]
MLYLFDGSVLETNRRELHCGGAAVDLEPQVFDLLEYLIRHRERVVSRDELIEQIWGGRIVSESALSTRINAVRSAIGDSGTRQRLIKTLPRKGIRFVGEVREEQIAPEEAAAAATDNIAAATSVEDRALAAVRAQPSIDNAAETPSAIAAAVRSRVSAPPFRLGLFPGVFPGIFAAVGLLCLGILTWGHFARSAQAERTRANAETAAKLTHIAEHINMTSREDDEAVRDLEQWAAGLGPQNVAAQTRLTFAIVTGVLNHWSDDVVADLHTADLALQEATRLAPDDMNVRGAQCHILRAMRQFESAITLCRESARRFPGYPFLHKEIGYNRLMLGQLDEAMAEFQEAERIAPDSRLRWSWNQGIGLIHLMQGQDEKAIDLLARVALEAPNAGHAAAYLASAYALVGREQEAREALAHYLKLWPKTTLGNFGPMVGTAAFNSRMERVIEGLRLAGLTERADDAPSMTPVARRADGAAHPDESHDVR